MKGMCFAKHRSWYTANSKRQRIATVSRYSWALEKENIWSWNRPSVRGTDSKNRSCCNECGLLYWESEAPWETDSLEVSCSSEFRNVCLHAHLKSRVFTSLCYCQTPLLFSCTNEYERLEILTVNLGACVHAVIFVRDIFQDLFHIQRLNAWLMALNAAAEGSSSTTLLIIPDWIIF